MDKTDYSITIRNKTLLIIYSKYWDRLVTFLCFENQGNYYRYNLPPQHTVFYTIKAYRKNICIVKTTSID